MAPAEFVNPLGHAGERGQPLPVEPLDPDASARENVEWNEVILCIEITTVVSVRLVFKVRNVRDVPMIWRGCYFSCSGYIICRVQHYFWLPTQKSQSVYHDGDG